MSSDPQIEYFRVEVRQFDEIESQIKSIREKIKPLNEKIKTLRVKRDELQRGICDYMAQNEIDACNLNSGKLEYKESILNPSSVFDANTRCILLLIVSNLVNVQFRSSKL